MHERWGIVPLMAGATVGGYLIAGGYGILFFGLACAVMLASGSVLGSILGGPRVIDVRAEGITVSYPKLVPFRRRLKRHYTWNDVAEISRRKPAFPLCPPFVMLIMREGRKFLRWNVARKIYIQQPGSSESDTWSDIATHAPEGLVKAGTLTRVPELPPLGYRLLAGGILAVGSAIMLEAVSKLFFVINF